MRTKFGRRWSIAPAPPEGRRSERFRSELCVMVRWSEDDRSIVMIEDVSVHGIKLRTDQLASPGKLIRIGLPSGRAPHARVVWAHGGSVACEFLTELSEVDLLPALSPLSV